VIGHSDTVKVKMNRATPAMYVIPNPVTENILHLQMNNMPKGVYHVRLFNNLGQAVTRNIISHAPGTATESIRPKYKLVSGIYQLEIISPDKKITTIKVVVK
jgi:Secretion system C-terminal sorting domain